KNIYPSIDELVPATVKHILPHSLVQTLEDRYAKLGHKYMTGRYYEDARGVREINGIANCDNLLSTIEELDDAVFNWLAWAFLSYGEVDLETITQENSVMVTAFMAIVDAYRIISLER